jgi:hypothetical protein
VATRESNRLNLDHLIADADQYVISDAPPDEA